jgi:monoamine oxidase
LVATNVYRAWYRPEFEAKYLDALRARQGSIIFANSDWAEGGWRSFIDGAIQSGTEAAFVVKNDLARLRKAQEKLQGAY